MRCPNCGFVIDGPRELTQSRLLHKAIAAYADACGYDRQWAKLELKMKYGQWEPVPLDLTGWEPPGYPGAFYEVYEGTLHHQIVFMKSEAAYTKGEEARLIDAVVARCYEAGADMRWYEEYQEEKIAHESQSKEEADRLPAGEGGRVAGVQPVHST